MRTFLLSPACAQRPRPIGWIEMIETKPIIEVHDLHHIYMRGTPLGRPPPYAGVMIKRYQWGHTGSFGVGEKIVTILEATYSREAVICPRAWKYPPVQNIAGNVYFRVVYNNKTVEFMAILGLTPEETEESLKVFEEFEELNKQLDEEEKETGERIV